MRELWAYIIEDEADLSDIFSESLRAAGFQTRILDDGLEASQQLETGTPDLIVLDLHLPGMDGSGLLDQIRSNARLSACKVIVATADHNLADTLAHKADLVLLKPISFGQLRDLSIRLKKMIAPGD